MADSDLSGNVSKSPCGIVMIGLKPQNLKLKTTLTLRSSLGDFTLSEQPASQGHSGKKSTIYAALS